ncbi:MAG: hypothetical protein RBR82_06215 [Pseudomonas sp.]|jgi:hypothetical protein|nr:hypothetical protein [Pseudomonas sp.]
MAKVFDSKKFLADRSCELRLSNGRTLEVAELPENAIEMLRDMTKDRPDATLSDEREQLAKFIGVDAEAFTGVGLIELRGVVDFLFSNLLSSK